MRFLINSKHTWDQKLEIVAFKLGVNTIEYSYHLNFYEDAQLAWVKTSCSKLRNHVLGIKNSTPWLLKIVGSSQKNKINWANRIFF
jgi:hypothetical protein